MTKHALFVCKSCSFSPTQRDYKFLEDLNENIFRAKGIIWFKESSLRRIFQLSGKGIELQTDQWQRKRSDQLVFNLDFQVTPVSEPPAFLGIGAFALLAFLRKNRLKRAVKF